jgi:nitrogen-specific signal transduction histidine kinase
VALAHGQLAIESEPGHTVVRALLPVDPVQAARAS